MATRRMSRREAKDANRFFGDIEDMFVGQNELHSRMDDDYALWRLDPFSPPIELGIAPEDAYTTNRPRVLAKKVIAFISNTEVVMRVPDSSQRNRESRRANDALEELAIGILKNADKRRRRRIEVGVQSALAAYTVIRGGWAAARGILRKRANGQTFEDILPLDPRHLIIQKGDEEPLWAAYRHSMTRGQIRDKYPQFSFRTETAGMEDDDQTQCVYDYYRRQPNPRYGKVLETPFDTHPFIYTLGVLIDEQWARREVNVHTMGFPVVAFPVEEVPLLAPSNKFDAHDMQRDFGESIFAEDRAIWERQSLALSYAMDLMAKSSDPEKKVRSITGTTDIEGAIGEKGATIPLSTANEEDVEYMQQPDFNRAALTLLQMISQDEITGSLPPQAFGILDKPLSSVALRQLGNNLEHKVLPRMKAVEQVIEGCLEVMIGQFETGAFAPIEVSGRRGDNTPFNRPISVEDIQDHDNLEVSLRLQLPEDDNARLAQANMLLQPVPGTNETLASVQYVRERVLNMQSSDSVRSQNLEQMARLSSPVALALEQFRAAEETGDEHLISVTFDQLQLAALQHTVQTNLGMAQLQQLMQGVIPPGMGPGGGGNGTGGAQGQQGVQGEALNPANGAIGVAEQRGIGNEASPNAGANATASRERQEENERLAAIGLERG